MVSVVDGEGWASSANSVDGIETSDTCTGEACKVKLFILGAGGSTDGILSIVEIRGDTI